MLVKSRPLVIVGGTAFAAIACEYFQADSEFDVVGFSVERNYLTSDSFQNLPVVPFEDLEHHFEPSRHSVFVAATYTQLNRLRARLLTESLQKGYQPASYISSDAFVWRNVKLGQHCFIFEGNVVQPFVTIGSNVVLWSGNHIGHHSTIGDHVFIASHAVISGYCEVGAYSFIGVNATIANNLQIGKDCVIGAGGQVSKDVPEDKIVRGAHGEPSGSARRLNRVREP